MLKLNLKKPILPQLEKAFKTGVCTHCGRVLVTGNTDKEKNTAYGAYLCHRCREKLGVKVIGDYLLVHAICSATIGGRKRRKRLK